MALDAFLELKDSSGNPAVEGEALDKLFGDPKRRAMSLLSFDLESQVDLAPRDATKKPRGAATAPSASLGSTAPSGTMTALSGVGDDGDDDGDQEYFTFTIAKDIDNATPQLFQAYCKNWTSVHSPDKADGKNKDEGKFASAKVTIRKAGGARPVEFLIFEFQEVWIKSWELTNKDGDELPEEEIEFGFNACKLRYYPQSRSGAVGKRFETQFFSFRSADGEEE